MSNIKLNLYNFDKKRGYIPLNKDNQPLFKYKKDYENTIDKVLEQLGLFNVKEEKFVKHYKNKNPDPNWIENIYGIGEKIETTIKYKKNTTRVDWLAQNYIYLYIKDESKLSWNTVIRTLKIKKIHKPFFITRYNIPRKEGMFYSVKDKSFHIKSKILAIPIYNNLNNDVIKKLINIFEGNLFLTTSFKYPFNFDTVITDAFTNKVLQLYQVFERAAYHKYLDINKSIENYKISKRIIYRDNSKYVKSNPEKTLSFSGKLNWEDDCLDWALKYSNQECKENCLYFDRDFVNHLSFNYKESWIIQNNDEFKDKLYQIYPNLIRLGLVNKSSAYIAKQEANTIIKAFLIKYKNNMSYWDLPIGMINKVDSILEKYSYIFDFCFHNQKDLTIKNQKFISNANRLSNAEKLNIVNYIVDKVFNETCIYTKESSKKQYRFFLTHFINEVFGKIKFDIEVNNKDYNRNKWSKFDSKLDKHIKGTFISNKEFNLFIDYLKDNYKEFNLTPSYNLKYKILKSIGLDIDEDYDFELYGKTILVKNDYVKHILYKLFLICNIKNNFINIYSKKLLDEIEGNKFKCLFERILSKLSGPPDECLIE